ncbi:MAG TPA: hypothetical protein VF526_08320 [Solirubrobacteraceae bacterium]|jgi:hypothetical protein
MGLLDDAIREHLELKRRRGADAVEISRLESEALGPVRRSPAGVPNLSDSAAAEPAAAEPVTAEPLAESAPADRPPWQDFTAAHPAGGQDDPTSPPSAYQPPPAPPSAPPSAHESPPASPSPPPSAYPGSVPTPPPAAYKPPPVFPASPPPQPPPTSILRPPPTAPKKPPEPEEPAAPAAEEPTPSLLSRFKPTRRRHARESTRDESPAAFVSPEAPALDDHEPGPPHATPPPAAREPDSVAAEGEPDPEDLLEETPEFLEETPEHDRLWFEQRPPRDFDFDG